MSFTGIVVIVSQILLDHPPAIEKRLVERTERGVAHGYPFFRLGIGLVIGVDGRNTMLRDVQAAAAGSQDKKARGKNDSGNDIYCFHIEVAVLEFRK
jgi:hypothetical protein